MESTSTLKLTTMVAYVLVAALAGTYAISQIQLYLRRRRYKAENNCQPLYRWIRPKEPFLGIDDVLARLKAASEHRILEFLVDMFEQIGYTMGKRVLGNNAIVTCEPDNIKTILSLRFKEFGMQNRMVTLGPLLGLGIFTADGERWAHSRALIRPNFVKDQVADLGAFERHMQDLFKLIPRDGSTFDLQELFFRLTIDSATEFLFGTSTNTLKIASPEAAKAFAYSFNKALYGCATRARVGPLIHFWPVNAEEKRSIKICHEYVDQFVDEAVRYREKLDLEKQAGIDTAKHEKYVFLHELAKATRDKKRLRDELLNVLLAGRDTTASLLSNMWFHIAKDPAIFAKLRAEVDATLPNGELPTYEKLRNMKYLKYCMNESLRLHPVVPANSRVAITDSVLPKGGGTDGQSPLFVSKGTIVMYNVYAMQRRKDLYGQDADEYKPERWETLRPGWEYLPFNGGPRICLGQQYALTEAGYVTVRLLQEFAKVESRDPGPWEESLTLTVCSRNGTQVGVWPAKGE